MKSKVLIIEDNEHNLYMTSFLLEKHGFEVYAAREGEEGIKKAAELLPDIILLDIQLPGMDGYTIARKLRNNEDLDETPICALTSYAMSGDREKALKAGCTAYIKKPINPDTFIEEIKSLLKL